MQIRQMGREDAKTVFEMMRDFYASEALLIHPNAEVLSRTLNDCLEGGPYLEGFVFDVEGVLAGYGMIAKSYSTEAGGKCIWIEDIFVLPEHRGKGIGSAFLDFVAKNYAHEAVRLRLEAEPENARAMQVYKKAGFEVLGYTQMIKSLEN